MIIPINNGRSITPIYILTVLRTNSGVSEQSNNTQNNEPTLASWVVLGVVLVFLIVFVAYFIKLLKERFGGKDD